MKLFKSIMVLLVIILCSCESSLNGPVGSDLTYEPVILSIGQEAEFGTIDDDTIKVKLVDRDKNYYILEYPNNQIKDCPLYASKMMLSFIMYDDKYKVTFNYKTTQNEVILQLYKYEILP
ncbi:hypothetical protein MNBD_IGNAVI01-654 [hydrothermal vent metagenome]|uniref:Lipoprotein n=1 Tax=hydrothermal vent metagenome TaxID=652676 RepID=A0A3B1BWB0_9ZZZZ